MTVIDEIVAAPAGARFVRADLHIHSFGASHDVKDTTMTPENIIKTAIAERLSLIALTDHNEISNVRAAIKANAGSLLVIPGVELSTPQGHLLVYFEAVEDLEALYGKLDIADRGKPDSRCKTSMFQCLELIDPKKGFAILAHVDADGGLEKEVQGYPPHKYDIISHPSLLGIELRNASSDVSFSESDPVSQRADFGRKRTETLKLGAKQFLARVLFSDSHSLAALGKNAQGKRKLTRIKMDQPSFNGLRVALQDADARIRLEDDIPASVPYLMGMKVEGGFLDGHVFHFSKNLNCIIGGRGAGKSTAFEAARSLAPTESTSKLIDSEVWPISLSLVWVDQAGQQHLIRRRINESAENISDPVTGPTSFSMESYGQNETAQTSTRAQQDPSALLEYIDQFTGVQSFASEEEEQRRLLLENQTAIETATGYVSRIPEHKKTLAHTEQQLKMLESANAREVVALERKVAEERGLRANLEKKLSELITELNSTAVIDILGEIRSAAKPEDLKVGSTELKNIIARTDEFSNDFNTAKTSSSAKGKTLVADLKKQLEQWKAKEIQITDEIEKKRKELLANNIRLDSLYIQKLAADETRHRATLKGLLEWEKKLKELTNQRATLLKERQEIRTKIHNARIAYSVKANKVLKHALSDMSVDVSFVENALSQEGASIIQEAMGWRTSQVPRASLIVEQLTIPKLLDGIRKVDPAPVMSIVAADKSRPFSKDDSLEILRTLALPQYLHRLQRCHYDDQPRITVTKKFIRAGKPEYLSRDFSKLSLGQQQSVLLALMLSSDSNSPLIIDQPEDNLDSEFIFHSLVPVLRSAKERRQVIVVTHNPNIAVLGDAEQIIALKSTSDKSVIVGNGSIDGKATRAVVCQILEGADEAFRRRAKVYGIS
jgi:energy-coupling factor transporter ATP-binding protein EcfA2